MYAIRSYYAGEHPDLPHEAVAADHGGELGLQDLEGDLAVVLEVFGELDGGHAALAELALDAVTGGQRRGQARIEVGQTCLTG